MISARIWLFGDLSQAESRVVAWRGPVPKLKEWYKRGDDVHSHVARLIARVVQESHLNLPNGMFSTKPWSEYGKGDPERDISKRVVHGSNYDMGEDKLSLVLNVPLKVAKALHAIYHALFPEIRRNYHAYIESCLKKNRTITTPEPVPFRKVFWSKLDPNVLRQAYASYPQMTVAMLLNNTLSACSNVFLEDEHENLRDHWWSYYGREHWDEWRGLRDSGRRTPKAILWSGMDIRFNVHDSIGVSIPNDPDLVAWAARYARSRAETPILIDPLDPLVIPFEFKIGPNAKDLVDYKLKECLTNVAS